ncbi:MAG TPA: DUF1801 domain-containing protein [Myxococcaceae bacterium]|nr:DUF1801 domain-containing protein [Myxococcaceae bacterium]
MPRKPSTIDEFLDGVTGARRTALDALRRVIRAAVPKAEECISYGIAAFRLDGEVIAGFAPTKKGCSYFPFSGSTLGALARELREYSQTKSALHFDPEQGLPAPLVRKLLRARIAETKSRKPADRRRR